MSRVNRGFNLTAMNGSVGAVTYVTRKGITVAKQKVPAKLNYRKTIRSMSPRMRWMAIVRLWQRLNVIGWHPSFNNKQGLQTDFNMFTKVNSTVDVYLPKDIVSADGAVVVPVQISHGGLAAVGGEISNGQFLSNLAVGGLTIGASTTLKSLSEAIIENNDDWMDGDQLTIVTLAQSTDLNGVPRVRSEIFEITLDTGDESTLIGDILPANTLSVTDGKLGLATAVIGGAAFVHSTGEGDTFDVSTEILAVANPTAQTYQGNNALMTAINSYGGLSANQFLVPNPIEG